MHIDAGFFAVSNYIQSGYRTLLRSTGQASVQVKCVDLDFRVAAEIRSCYGIYVTIRVFGDDIPETFFIRRVELELSFLSCLQNQRGHEVNLSSRCADGGGVNLEKWISCVVCDCEFKCGSGD